MSLIQRRFLAGEGRGPSVGETQWVGAALGRTWSRDGLFLLAQTVIVGSYLIAHGFFSVYGMCVDTLFLCFCE